MNDRIDELYPEDCHAKRMWQKYDEIGPDTTPEERLRVISEMKAMQREDEELHGKDALFDSSIFWGVLGDEHSDAGEWSDASDCFLIQIDALLDRTEDQDDPLWKATATRAATNLVEAYGLDASNDDEEAWEHLRDAWAFAMKLIDEGWDDDALYDMDDLYWLVRRKALYTVGANVAIERGDREAALSLLTDFISEYAEIPEGDTWDEVYDELIDLGIMQLRLAEEAHDGDRLIAGLKWLESNMAPLLEHTSEIAYRNIHHLVYFFAAAGSSAFRIFNEHERGDELWTAGLELLKEIYREGETVGIEGLKAHLALFRELADRHRETDNHEESLETEREIRKVLDCITPHWKDPEVIHERVSNGMFLGSYAEDRGHMDDMLDYWTYALDNLLDVDGDEEWARNVYLVMKGHWQDKEPMFSDPDKMQAFIEVLHKCDDKFDA